MTDARSDYTPTAAMHIDFYADPISPYVYIAWHRLQALQARRPELRVRVRPILFAALLAHGGQLGPAEIPSKRVFTFKDVWRRCAEHGLPVRGPATHPFNPLLALRAMTAAAEADRPRALTAVLACGWTHGHDLADPAAITAALSDAGLDGPALVDAAADPIIKQAVVDETRAAIDRGVFGVPTFGVGAELVWGQDRIGDVENILDGRDAIDAAQMAAVLARPAGATRPR
jgi:2-hydroxychromene-2-carboxylate isomerase